jgi:hypothetical protein
MVEISFKPSDFFMVEQFSIHTLRCFLKCLAERLSVKRLRPNKYQKA